MASVPVTPIRLGFTTSAPADLVWTYLTDPERVEEWFTEASPLGAIGEPYRLDFGDGSVVEGVITALEPGARFAHRWAWLDIDPRMETLVTWTVEPFEAGGSRVDLSHEGWSEAGADEAMRDDHEAYWSGYLDDLQDVLEDAIHP
ncbi:MAG: SRPBCC domain-containing protein [Chloroflexota bacterium]